MVFPALVLVALAAPARATVPSAHVGTERGEVVTGAIHAGDTSCTAPLSGPLGALVVNGKPLMCNTLIARCTIEKPDDVAWCMAIILEPAGLSVQRCLPCWR